MARPELVLVTSAGCHYCDRAHDLLDQLRVSTREISVDSEEAEGLAGAGVPLAFLPVLLDGDRVVAYGRFSEKRLRKELSL